MKGVVVLVLLLMAFPVWAEEHREPFSRKAQVTGGVVTLVGFLALAYGHGDERDVRVLDTSYCVSPYEVRYGVCRISNTQIKISVWTMVAGVGLVAIGSIPVTRHVTVTPSASRAGVRAVAMVKWGGK
jgi:hypothetical protein